jgi:hypothetical protein
MPNWQLCHLYAPQAKSLDSTMPPYRFLFEKRKVGKVPSADALKLTGEFAPPAGYEIVPTDDARALVAYLLSLRTDAPLFESPLTPPPGPPRPPMLLLRNERRTETIFSPRPRKRNRRP